MILEALFSKEQEYCESLLVLLPVLKKTLSSLIIPAKVTNLTIKLLKARFIISASRCGYNGCGVGGKISDCDSLT